MAETTNVRLWARTVERRMVRKIQRQVTKTVEIAMVAFLAVLAIFGGALVVVVLAH